MNVCIAGFSRGEVQDGSIFQIQVNQNQWLRRIYSKEVHI